MSMVTHAHERIGVLGFTWIDCGRDLCWWTRVKILPKSKFATSTPPSTLVQWLQCVCQWNGWCPQHVWACHMTYDCLSIAGSGLGPRFIHPLSLGHSKFTKFAPTQCMLLAISRPDAAWSMVT